MKVARHISHNTLRDTGGRQERAWFVSVLHLAVHLDALRLNPRKYLLALWWKLCGKRLRARSVFAPLLGQSRWAYRLWLTQERRNCYDGSEGSAGTITLFALVENGKGSDRTLASLAREGITARQIISSPETDLAELQQNSTDAWFLIMKGGDLLAEGADATYRAAAERASGSTHCIYADDDLISDTGRRRDPHFKPSWNSELYRHFDYLTGAAIVRARGLDFSDLPPIGWAEALVARAAKRSEDEGGEIIHVPRMLHHRPMRPAAQRPGPDRRPATNCETLLGVSVLIPTRNGLALLRKCLEGVARTNYPKPLEILVIDNGSDDPETLEYLAGLDSSHIGVLRDNGPFNFAALNNRGVSRTTGDLLCFLNNDIEIGDPGWLMTMARQAQRGDVGAVGARLLYPDGRIQHAGVVLGLGGGAGHAHRLLDPDEEGYFDRHALPQFVSAVTAACLVVSRDKFLAVGGFDAERFAVAFNDVDLCLRLGQKGWKTVYEPRATLVHHESVSRGFDRDPVGAARLAQELAALQELWGTSLEVHNDRQEPVAVDPFHHPSLSPFSERFVLRL